MIDSAIAGRLLDFGARIGQGSRAEAQLQGAVAVHNILQKHRVAYLADEVGMGKTYVALGALALFRHFQPDFRVLIIAPRENIQRKWVKEWSNFARHNMKFADMRVSSIDRRPARQLVTCGNLVEFVRAIAVDPTQDLFLRLTSFSLPLGHETTSWRQLRDKLRLEVPWVPNEAFDLRNKEEFKDNFARALCCALPKFDLVIVDEGHNLKYGWRHASSIRNKVLALAFGHPDEHPSRKLFPNYGPRAERVLFLSATPLEETYQHLWNQLDIFGLAGGFQELSQDSASEDEKKRVASMFLVRRVTSIQVADQELTKNQYRREWRSGGVTSHDEPIRVTDVRQRLVVALIQKKVAELLGSEQFNSSFQIGMLASFESFLETARLKRNEIGAESTFDDPEQAQDDAEREGIDVRDVNRLARDYRRRFGRELPHPKMDALVASLSNAWIRGEKALVFVRRVASVRELKFKLDELYDDWLISLLRRELPDGAQARFGQVVTRYMKEKAEAEGRRREKLTGTRSNGDSSAEGALEDRGGNDTFFAWFFRGEGPKGVVSGANIQRRFIQRSSTYATFFADNYIMELLGSEPGRVCAALAHTCNLEMSQLRSELSVRAAKYLSRARKHQSADRMDSAQAAALELLKERTDSLGEKARVIWHELYEDAIHNKHSLVAPDVSEWLEQPTFFTELRRPNRTELRDRLWKRPGSGSFRDCFREQYLRTQLLSTAARLGHAFIDLYILAIQRLGSLETGVEEADSDVSDLDLHRINQYLDLLESQRSTSLSGRRWAAFDELTQIAEHYELILDVNAPDARTKPLAETARYFGALLRQQQPVGGMSGQVNRTLLQQFRMPGYPYVLISTDLLQEGEDLHTFCSSIYHYGISWTPSAMEQRIGRIDRVRSQTDRRLNGLTRSPQGEDLLQVYFPYLEDTVEVLQVQRVLERMNLFLRLMHEGLTTPKSEQGRIDVARELTGGRRVVEAIQERLRSAFPIPDWATKGTKRALAVEEHEMSAALSRFCALSKSSLTGLDINWESDNEPGTLLGTVRLTSGRIQPIKLRLLSEGKYLVVKCLSPICCVDLDKELETLQDFSSRHSIRLCIAESRIAPYYNVSVEGDVLLTGQQHDRLRVSELIGRVVDLADEVEWKLGSEDRTLNDLQEQLNEQGDIDNE